MIKAFFLSTLLIGLLFIKPIKLSCKKTRRKKRNIKKSNTVLSKIIELKNENKDAQAISYLRKIDPYVFEELLLTALEKKGFKIVRNKRYSHDGGIDGKAYLNEELHYIQAKRYSSYVSPKHLADFQKLVGSQRGFFVHTGRTGKQTYKEYKYSNIEIISGTKLIDLLSKNR